MHSFGQIIYAGSFIESIYQLLWRLGTTKPLQLREKKAEQQVRWPVCNLISICVYMSLALVAN
jgi:hypothetical protein